MKTWEKILIIVLIIDVQYEKDLASTNFYQRIEEQRIKGSINESFKYQNKEIYKHTSYDETGMIQRMLYKDNETKEFWIFIQKENEKQAIKMDYYADPIAIVTTHTGLSTKEIWQEIVSSITARVTKDKWANGDCYKIEWGKEIDLFVDKQSKRVIGERNGYTKIDTYITDNISTYYYEENTLTKEDVEMPDLEGYTIKDSRTKKMEV